MDNKINKLLSFIKGLSNADIDRVLEYVIEILKVNNQQADRRAAHTAEEHISSRMGIRTANSVSIAMTAGSLICGPPIHSWISRTIHRLYGPNQQREIESGRKQTRI